MLASTNMNKSWLSKSILSGFTIFTFYQKPPQHWSSMSLELNLHHHICYWWSNKTFSMLTILTKNLSSHLKLILVFAISFNFKQTSKSASGTTSIITNQCTISHFIIMFGHKFWLCLCIWNFSLFLITLYVLNECPNFWSTFLSKG